MDILNWEQTEDLRHRCFQYPFDEPKGPWLSTSWQHLVKVGWASYDDDLKRHRCLILFIALIGIYSWCLNMRLGDGMSVNDLVTSIGVSDDEHDECLLSTLRVGQLLQGESLADDSHEAVVELICREAPAVAKVLVDAFDGESMFFVSLWRSGETPGRPEVDEDDDEYEEKSTESEEDYEKRIACELLNVGLDWGDDYDGRQQVFNWVSEGCYIDSELPGAAWA